MRKVNILFWVCVAVFLSSLVSEGSQIDFGWSVPENILHSNDSGGGQKYLIWFYSIKNTTDKKILVPLETFLTTDTDKNYEDKYVQDVVSSVTKDDTGFMSAKDMKGEFAPGVTKKGVALFENIDPYAQQINIFVTGLSHFFFWRWRMVDYSYKISYQKKGDTWILLEHGFSKDTSHRNYSDWTNQMGN